MTGTRTNMCGCGIILLVLSNVIVSHSFLVSDFDADIYNDELVEFEGSAFSRTSRQIPLSSEILPTSPIICRKKSSTKRYPNPLYIRRRLDPGTDFFTNPKGYIVGVGAAKLSEDNSPASVRRVMSVYNGVLQPLKLSGVALPITIRGRNGIGVTFENAFFEGIPLVDVSRSGFVKVLILQELIELPNKLANGKSNYSPVSNLYLECKQESQVSVKFSGTSDISMLSEAVGNLKAGTGPLKSLTSLSPKPVETSAPSSASAAPPSSPFQEVPTTTGSLQDKAQKIAALVIQLQKALEKERVDIAIRRQAREEQQKAIRRLQQEQRRSIIKEKTKDIQLEFEIKMDKLASAKKNRRPPEQLQIQKLQEAFGKEKVQRIAKLEESELLFQRMRQEEDNSERAREEVEDREKLAKLEKEVLVQLLAIKKRIDDEKKENDELKIRLQQQIEERKRKEEEVQIKSQEQTVNVQETETQSTGDVKMTQNTPERASEFQRQREIMRKEFGSMTAQSDSVKSTEEAKQTSDYRLVQNLQSNDQNPTELQNEMGIKNEFWKEKEQRSEDDRPNSQNTDKYLEEEQQKMDESASKVRSEYSRQRTEETSFRSDSRSERSDEPRSKRQKVDLAEENWRKQQQRPQDSRPQTPQLDQIYQDEKQRNEKIWNKIKSKDLRSRSEDSASGPDDLPQIPDDPRPETKQVDPIYADEKQKNDKVWKNIKSKDSSLKTETEQVTLGPELEIQRPDDFRPGDREVDVIFQDERQKTNKVWRKTKTEGSSLQKEEIPLRPEEPSSKNRPQKIDLLSQKEEKQRTDSQVKKTESKDSTSQADETRQPVDPIVEDEKEQINDKIWSNLESQDSRLQTVEAALVSDEPGSKLDKTTEEAREKINGQRPAGSEIQVFDKLLKEEKQKTDEYFRKLESRSRLRADDESKTLSKKTESLDQKVEDAKGSVQSSKSDAQSQSSVTSDDTNVRPGASNSAASSSSAKVLDRDLVRKLAQEKVAFEEELRAIFPPGRPSTGGLNVNILNILTIRLGQGEKIKVDGVDVVKTDSSEDISEEVTSKKESGAVSKTKSKKNKKRTISCVRKSLNLDAPNDPTKGLKLLSPEYSIFKSTKRGAFSLSYLRSVLSTIGSFLPTSKIFTPSTLFTTVSTDRNGILQGGLVEIIARFLEPANLANVAVQPLISSNGRTVAIIAGKTIYEAKFLLDENSLKSSHPRTVLHLYKLVPAGANYQGIQIYKYEGGQFTDCHEEFDGKRYTSEGDTKNEESESILGIINLRELLGTLT